MQDINKAVIKHQCKRAFRTWTKRKRLRHLLLTCPTEHRHRITFFVTLTLILIAYVKTKKRKIPHKIEDIEMDRKTIAPYPCHVP